MTLFFTGAVCYGMTRPINNFRARRTPLLLFSSGRTAFFKARVMGLSCNLFQSHRMQSIVFSFLSLSVVVVVVVVAVVSYFYSSHNRLLPVGSRFTSRP
jgi:hypothetical protein